MAQQNTTKTLATTGVILDDTNKRELQEEILFVIGLEEKNLLASITKAKAKKEAESERLASAVVAIESEFNNCRFWITNAEQHRATNVTELQSKFFQNSTTLEEKLARACNHPTSSISPFQLGTIEDLTETFSDPNSAVNFNNEVSSMQETFHFMEALKPLIKANLDISKLKVEMFSKARHYKEIKIQIEKAKSEVSDLETREIAIQAEYLSVLRNWSMEAQVNEKPAENKETSTTTFAATFPRNTPSETFDATLQDMQDLKKQWRELYAPYAGKALADAYLSSPSPFIPDHEYELTNNKFKKAYGVYPDFVINNCACQKLMDIFDWRDGMTVIHNYMITPYEKTAFHINFVSLKLNLCDQWKDHHWNDFFGQPEGSRIYAEMKKSFEEALVGQQAMVKQESLAKKESLAKEEGKCRKRKAKVSGEETYDKRLCRKL